MHAADASTSLWSFLPGFIVAGAGFGLMVSPIGVFTLADVPVEKAGSASGLFSTTGQLAGAAGVAVVGSLFFSVVDAHASSAGGDVPAAMEAALAVLVALMLVAAVVARQLPAMRPGSM